MCRKAEPMNKISKDHNQILNYLVPTPLVLANVSTNVPPKSRKAFATKGGNSPKPATPAMTSMAPPAHPAVPSEVNVVVIPPPVKEPISPARFRDRPVPKEQKPAECASPRGPLSYEGLVQLRKAASMKRSQEGSRTAENQDKQPSKPIKNILLDNRSPHAPVDQHGLRKAGPPAVAPKPKKIPSNIPVSTTCPQTEKTVMNPQKVRMEALYKLGLLKDQESSTTPCPSQPQQLKWVNPPSCPPPPPPPSTTRHQPDPSSVPEPPHCKPPPVPTTMDQKISSEPPHCKPPPVPPATADPKMILEPPFCKPPPVPTTAEPKMRQTHWTSGVVHHRSLSDLAPSTQQLTVKPVTGKSATLERSGPGLSSSISSHTISDGGYKNARNNSSELRHNNNYSSSSNSSNILHHTKPRSSTLDMKINCKDSGQRDGGDSLSQRRSSETGVKGQTPSQAVGHSVLVVPRMGDDRKEALRKLGLLKD